MYIQKLTYIAHGWNLAINGQPLTIVPPEAWENGPVYREIWDHIRDYGYKGANFTLVDPHSGEQFQADLSTSELQVVDHVWKKYRDKTASELSRMTHEPGTPWFNAFSYRGKNASLSNVEIRQHYIDLALAGRERR